MPNETYPYVWYATQHGSHWYHAHASHQLEDGFFGPLIIHPKKGRDKPWGLIAPKDNKAIAALEKAERRTHPLIISDFMHMTAEDKHDLTVESGIEHTCYDSITFNGKGRVTCLDPEVVAESMNDIQRMFLDALNETMTDKS